MKAFTGKDIKGYWSDPDWPDDASIDDDAYRVNGVEISGSDFDAEKLADTDSVEILCGSVIQGDTGKDLARAVRAWIKARDTALGRLRRAARDHGLRAPRLHAARAEARGSEATPSRRRRMSERDYCPFRTLGCGCDIRFNGACAKARHQRAALEQIQRQKQSEALQSLTDWEQENRPEGDA